MATNNIDWGSLVNGLIGAAGTYYGNKGQNNATQNAIQQTQFNPYNTAFQGLGASIFGNNTIGGGLDPSLQALQSLLTSQATSNLNGLPNLGQALGTANGGNDSQLASQLASMGGNFLNGIGANAPQVNSNTPGSIYGTYGDRLAMLRESARPQEDRYLQNNFDNQFGKGILASTAGQYQTQGALDAINQADLQRQQSAYGMAGDDYTRALQANAQGLQAQQANQNAFLTQQGLRGQLGQGLSGLGLQGSLQSTGDRFNRALATFGAQNNAAGQSLQGIGGLANIPIQLAQLGANLGSQRSGANAFGAQAGINQAGNNANTWSSVLNGLTNALDIGGMISGAFGGKGGNNFLGGMANIPNGLQNIGTNLGQQSPNWWGIKDPTFGSFNGAGGQAANFAGGQGISDLINNGVLMSINNNDAIQSYAGDQWSKLNNQLNNDPNMQGSAGSSWANAVNTLGGINGIYQGINQGDAAGYIGAATNAANLAGIGQSITPYAGVATSLAKGDTYGAGIGAADLLMGGPYAAIGNAIAGIANHAFLGDASKDRNMNAFNTINPLGLQQVSGPSFRGMINGGYLTPDGKLLSSDYVNDLAGSWYGANFAPDGNPGDWQKKYEDFLANPRYASMPKGYEFKDGRYYLSGKPVDTYINGKKI